MMPIVKIIGLWALEMKHFKVFGLLGSKPLLGPFSDTESYFYA